MTDGAWAVGRPTDGRQVPHMIRFDRSAADINATVNGVFANVPPPNTNREVARTGTDFQSEGRATPHRPFPNVQVTGRPTAITFLTLSI